jgi:hypothetical protein
VLAAVAGVIVDGQHPAIAHGHQQAIVLGVEKDVLDHAFTGQKLEALGNFLKDIKRHTSLMT